MSDEAKDGRSSAPMTGGSESIDSVLRAVAHEASIPMEALSTVDAPATPEPTLDPLPLPRVGEVLGRRYRIDALLGAGGMGAVFAARHVKTGKEVAIKVLLPRHGLARFSPDRIARFVREAQAAGRIRHPNVVDVYDVEEGEGTPYLVMERLYGESLWQRIRRGAMPADAAMRGVAEAHRQGVIHRDLKPDNIFLARTNEQAEPVPKVLDFGVSRIVARADSEDPHPTTLTETGLVVGTPAYMPLEQLRGDRQVDARADVYALGVILYEALSGERPYDAQNNHELVIRMVTEAPIPLGRKVKELDPRLEHIVMTALASKPDDRYPDVDAFASALTGFLRGDPTVPSRLEPTTDTQMRAMELATAPSQADASRGAPPRARKVWVAGLALLLLLAVLWMARGREAQEAPVLRAVQPAPQREPAPRPVPATRVVEEPTLPKVVVPEQAPEPLPTVGASPGAAKKRSRVDRPSPAADGEAPRKADGPDPATEVTLDDF
jgi:hypothetical protein